MSIALIVGVGDGLSASLARQLAARGHHLVLAARDTDKLAEPVYNCLRAGELSLHADMLAHGSDPNTSDRRRCGLTIRYCPVTVHAGEGWNAGASICRGTDPTGHWPNNPRPPGEDPAGGPGQVAAD